MGSEFGNKLDRNDVRPRSLWLNRMRRRSYHSSTDLLPTLSEDLTSHTPPRPDFLFGLFALFTFGHLVWYGLALAQWFVVTGVSTGVWMVFLPFQWLSFMAGMVVGLIGIGWWAITSLILFPFVVLDGILTMPFLGRGLAIVGLLCVGVILSVIWQSRGRRILPREMARHISQQLFSNSVRQQEPARGQCAVCFELASPDEKSVKCSVGHVCCSGCMSSYIRVTWSTREMPRYPVPLLECIEPGCNRPLHLHQVYQAIDAGAAEALARSQENYIRIKVLAELSGSAHEGDQRLLRSFLQSAGGGRMCRKCRYGPVYNDGCNNTVQHHGQQPQRTTRGAPAGARYNNACPGCGDLATSWEQWLPWDGVLRDVDQRRTVSSFFNRVSMRVRGYHT